ncbi:MAG: type II secretion system protein [Phycisphaeraceae bacterium]|nr:type II secretion system protein [Phycisphaeraceae bacterium]
MTLHAFTLIELLVVVAVIAILISLLLPGLAGARLASRGVVCASNMRQIAAAITLYADAHKGAFPRTMELVDGIPETINWWAIRSYQRALEEYIGVRPGGVDATGSTPQGRGVWFDPADPDRLEPAMWGSFSDNGLITGVPRKLADLRMPSSTVFQTLRERGWAEVVGVVPPDPLPVGNPDHPFWSSEYFDLCLDPWAETTDRSHPYHWSRGRAMPPSDTSNEGWDQQIDGRWPGRPGNRPRYGPGQYYSYLDGSVRFERFEQTYVDARSDRWSIR